MSAATDALRKALEFLDAVRADPKTASMVGAMRDAREWVEEAAREVVRQDTITQYYTDRQGKLCARDAAGYTSPISDGGMDPRN